MAHPFPPDSRPLQVCGLAEDTAEANKIRHCEAAGCWGWQGWGSRGGSGR